MSPFPLYVFFILYAIAINTYSSTSPLIKVVNPCTYHTASYWEGPALSGDPSSVLNLLSLLDAFCLETIRPADTTTPPSATLYNYVTRFTAFLRNFRSTDAASAILPLFYEGAYAIGFIALTLLACNIVAYVGKHKIKVPLLAITVFAVCLLAPTLTAPKNDSLPLVPAIPLFESFGLDAPLPPSVFSPPAFDWKNSEQLGSSGFCGATDSSTLVSSWKAVEASRYALVLVNARASEDEVDCSLSCREEAARDQKCSVESSPAFSDAPSIEKEEEKDNEILNSSSSSSIEKEEENHGEHLNSSSSSSSESSSSSSYLDTVYGVLKVVVPVGLSLGVAAGVGGTLVYVAREYGDEMRTVLTSTWGQVVRCLHN